MQKCGFEVESLSAHRVADKLVSSGIEVLGAEKIRKNAIIVWVNGKDEKKVFAILRGSCYNILKVRYRGMERFKRECIRRAGLVAGAAVFLLLVCFMQTRILKIEIVGSGAYYEREVREILSKNSAGLFSEKPKEGAVTSEILSLPRVSFCSLALSGGVLTVTVEVSDENALAECTPLVAPHEGTLEELVVVRGTPLANIGDEVKRGDVLVAPCAPVGEDGTRSVIVIARAKISVAVSREYALSESAAIAQAYLDFGEMTQLKATPTESGVRVEGLAHFETALNLD